MAEKRYSVERWNKDTLQAAFMSVGACQHGGTVSVDLCAQDGSVFAHGHLGVAQAEEFWRLPPAAGEQLLAQLEHRVIAAGSTVAIASQDGPEFHARAAAGWTLAPPPLTHMELMQLHQLVLEGRLPPMHSKADISRDLLRRVTLGPAPAPPPKKRWLVKRIERNRQRKEAGL